MNTSEEWTDDMNISISSDKTIKELTSFLMLELESNCNHDEIIIKIITNYGTSENDAELALDRVQGGIIRALTGNPSNEPEQEKDPLAWYSFNSVWPTLPRKHLFSKNKKASGKWQHWYNVTRSNS